MLYNNKFDVIIIGGGLAGLSASIQLIQAGFSVALFEKEQYPFHKVCGEYISLESWKFIESLGVNLAAMQLPIITHLLVTAPNGNALQHKLDLGGFGISRYTLDNDLKNIAIKKGVVLFENTKVENAVFKNDVFNITTNTATYTSTACFGSFGKKSNLDVKWKRPFVLEKKSKQSHYIAVKYHIQIDTQDDTIALHNFKNGYCGISKIEGNKYCLCYLTTSDNLKKNGHSIAQMEQQVLYKNPHLKKIFTQCKHLYAAPVSIANISFSKKTNIHQHILLAGDAAGLITPLCGNGMSMALHSSKLASELLIDFLNHKINRATLEKNYSAVWQKQFKNRLFYGNTIQYFFGNVRLTNISIQLLKFFPSVTHFLIKQTHGKPF